MEGKFRENLRYELDFQGITVKELSEKTEIPKATLECYLGARANMPSAEFAVKIAQTLGVTVEYLITGEDLYRNKHPAQSQEMLKLHRDIEKLNNAQCKAFQGLIKSFKEQDL